MSVSEYIISFIFVCCFSAFSFGQQKPRRGEGPYANGSKGEGKITGVIADSETGKPVEFAAISLFKTNPGNPDSLISGAITASSGKFRIEQVPLGTYRLDVTFIGYNVFHKDSILISPLSSDVDLGKLTISPNPELLKEVEVVGEKRMLEMAIDKKVFNVEKNIVSAGGSATDVLQNVPSVSVDIDGNISLRGSGNVTVLIDGKPSGLTGSSRTAVLQQIPASSIESVEVITNPSVKYDPDGMSGIINIVLKKNQKKGANGLISAGAGTFNKYNASCNLNYRNRKINAYVNYSFRLNPRYGKGTMLRENFFTDSTWYLNQYSNSNSTPTSHMVKTGVDFFPNDNNTIGISTTLNKGNDLADETVEYQNLNWAKNLTGLSFRNISEDEESENADLSVSFKHTFNNPKQVMTADVNYSNSFENNEEHYSQQEYFTDNTPMPTDPDLQNTYSDLNHGIFTGMADYVHPLKEKAKIETGTKSIIRNVENYFQSEIFDFPSSEWQSDSLRNNHYFFQEQVHAGYGTYSNAFRKFSFQVGLRLEQAYTFSKQLLAGTENKKDYFSYFPGGHFSWKFSKSSEFQVSYSKRINRPSVQSLIAFMDYDDPLNIRLGNPDLKPEYIHSIELSHAFQNEKNTLTSSVYYRQVVDMIQRFRSVNPATGVAIIRFENYAGATNMGFEFVARNELFKWWAVTSNLNLYKSVINATNIESDLHNEGFGWSGKMTSNFTFPKIFQIQISGNYRAPTPVAIGTMNAMYSVEFGIKKDVLKGKGSINLNAGDIFDTRQFGVDIVQPGYHHTFTRKRESRIVTLNFTYKFGKAEGRQKQKGRGEGENQQLSGEEMF